MADQGGTTQPLRVKVAILALVLGLTACRSGSSLSPSVEGSGSPSASTSETAAASESASPSAAPGGFNLLPAEEPADFVSQIVCTGTIGAEDPVAIVRMQGSQPGTGDVVLRDYADQANPTTPCTFGSEAIAQLIDAQHIVIRPNDGIAVVDLPNVTYHWFDLPQEKFLAVAPTLDQLLWMDQDPIEAKEDTIHLTTSAGDQVVATLPNNNEGRCGSPEFDSKWSAYTRSGSHFFVLDQPFPETTSLIAGSGATPSLSLIAPSGGWAEGMNPMMALWSPTTDTLYYRRGGDIWQWTEGTDPFVFLPEVSWVQPTISADGVHLAYAVLRADGVLHDVYLVDLTTAVITPDRIGDGARKLPVFLNATQLWFLSEGEDHGCVGGEAERPLIYDIVDGLEFNSVIEQPLFVWPATSAIY